MCIARKLYSTIISIFCTIVMLSAQNVKVPQNALFRHLLRDTVPVSSITLSIDPIIPQPPPFQKNFQQLMKSKSGLYVFIDGTGRIFKATSWDNNWINFERIDSTVFFGFNKGSQKFIIGDTIFSFGGYGFWHFNGSLSYFTPRKEWEMLPLNKEVPYFNINDRISSICQYDSINRKFYFSGIHIGQQTTTNAEANDSFYVFDICKRHLSAIGKSIFGKEEFGRYSSNIKVETPFGILMDSPFDDNRDVIFNIKDNLMYASDNRIIQQLIPSSAYTSNNILFYQNGYLFVSAIPFSKMDSLKFDFRKFKLMNTAIYTVNKTNKDAGFINYFERYGNYILAGIISILLLLVIYLLRIKNLKTKIDNSLASTHSAELLSSLEKQLLKQFIVKIEKNEFCSTIELNNLLGVSLKSNEIKKKARTDFITKVNYKLKQHFSVSEDIITRNRSEEDKRSYLYSIPKKLISEVKLLID